MITPSGAAGVYKSAGWQHRAGHDSNMASE